MYVYSRVDVVHVKGQFNHSKLRNFINCVKGSFSIKLVKYAKKTGDELFCIFAGTRHSRRIQNFLKLHNYNVIFFTYSLNNK